MRWVSVATPPPESLWAWNDSFIVRDTHSSVAYVANFDGTGWSRWDESRYEVDPTEWLAGVNDAWFIMRRLAMFAYAIQVERFANEQGVDVDVHESGRRLTVEVRFASSPEKITLCSLEHEDGFPVELWLGSQPPVRCESIEGVDEGGVPEAVRVAEAAREYSGLVDDLRVEVNGCWVEAECDASGRAHRASVGMGWVCWVEEALESCAAYELKPGASGDGGVGWRRCLESAFKCIPMGASNGCWLEASPPRYVSLAGVEGRKR